jgi:hypothetical protein
MSIFKTFQLNYPEGGVTVQFYLEFDGNKVVVKSIKVNRSFSTDQLPRNATLEWHEDKWKLCRHFKQEGKEHAKDIVEYMDNEMSNDIVARILHEKYLEEFRILCQNKVQSLLPIAKPDTHYDQHENFEKLQEFINDKKVSIFTDALQNFKINKENLNKDLLKIGNEYLEMFNNKINQNLKEN